MKTKSYLAGIAFSTLMVGFSGAAVTINGFVFDDTNANGNLDNNTGGGNTNPSTFTSSVVQNSTSSVTINGVFGSNSYIFANLSIAEGDTIEFDQRYSDTASQGTDNYSRNNGMRLFNASNEQLFEASSDQAKSLWVTGSGWGTDLPAPGTYHITLQFIGGNLNWTAAGTNETPAAGRSGSLALDRTAVNNIRFGVNDSRRALTIENFTVTPVPEPSVALLGAVGLLGLIRRRRA